MIDFFSEDNKEQKIATYTVKDYLLHKEILDRIIEQTEQDDEDLPRRIWMFKLTYPQWIRWQSGELNVFDPLYLI